jgi:hypothetical protein
VAVVQKAKWFISMSKMRDIDGKYVYEPGSKVFTEEEGEALMLSQRTVADDKANTDTLKNATEENGELHE